MSKESNSRSSGHQLKIAKKEGRGDTYFVDDIIIDKSIHGNTVEITWQSDETDFEIWFPAGQNPVSNTLLLRRLSLRSLGKVVKRRLNNLKNMKPGIYYYSIHCKQNGTTGSMAEGNSPPRMIIR